MSEGAGDHGGTPVRIMVAATGTSPTLASTLERCRLALIGVACMSALATLDLMLVLSDGRVQAFGPKEEVLRPVLRPSQAPASAAAPAVATLCVRARDEPVQPARPRLLRRAPRSVALPRPALDPLPSPGGAGPRPRAGAGIGGWATLIHSSAAAIAPGQIIIAATASSHGKIVETELQIIPIDREMRTEVGKDLAGIRGKWSEFVEKRVAAQDQLMRIDMRAPQDGIVHQLSVHTVGGLVTPNEPAMLIVLQADQLLVEVRV